MTGLLVSLLLAGAAPATQVDGLATFERKFAADDFEAAAKSLNAMVQARPPAGLVPDPLLSGLEGRLLLRRAPPTAAMAYLQFGDSDAVPMPQRVSALLALGEAREAAGDRPGAAETYRRLLALPLAEADRRRARLGIARTRLADAPREAAEMAQAVAASGTGAESWEANLVVAEADLLAGDRAAAAAALDRSWAEAADAPAADFAAQRVATVRAALAAADGRREGVIAALNTAGGARRIAGAVADSLPICVAGRLEPSDWVTFAAFGDVGEGRWLAPVSASRQAVVAPFTDALAGLRLFDDQAAAAAGGVIFTVRCRIAPSAHYRPPSRDPDPLPLWFASRGLFLPLFGRTLADINLLSGQIEDLAAARPDDPRLIPLRIALGSALRARAATSSDVPAWQVAQLDEKARQAMQRIGGAEAFPFRLMEIGARRPENQAEAAGLLASIGSVLADYAAQAPVDYAYEVVARMFTSESPLPVELRRTTIAGLAKRLADRPGDLRRQSLQMALVDLERDSGGAVKAAWQQTGLPDDLCRAGDEVPSIVEHHIDDSDFPGELLRFALTGVTVFEANVGTDGKLKGSRIILSAPSRLFDPTVMAKLPAFEMRPMQLAGKARECRGFTQRVLWKFPEGNSNPMPGFSEPDGPVS